MPKDFAGREPYFLLAFLSFFAFSFMQHGFLKRSGIQEVFQQGSVDTNYNFSCIILTFSVHVMLKQVRHSECDKTVGALLLQMRVQYWIFIAWLLSINLLFFRIDVFLLSKHFKSI